MPLARGSLNTAHSTAQHSRHVCVLCVLTCSGMCGEIPQASWSGELNASGELNVLVCVLE
jgi:hypothetical protein